MNDVEERGARVIAGRLTREGDRQIEAEAVDVHLLDPVAQAVGDQLERLGAAHVERVARTGEVAVVAGVVRHQVVVGEVGQAAE